MLTSLEWQTLEQRRRISRLVMMYKIQHQLVDIDQDLYLRPGDSRTIGQHRFFQKLLPKNSTRVEPRIVKFLVVHSLGDISCVCLACLVPQNLKQSAMTPVLHWKKKKMQCGCTCVYGLLIAFSKFLTERHVHTSIRQQSESVGLSCQNLNLSILHIFKSMI